LRSATFGSCFSSYFLALDVVILLANVAITGWGV
jgi:hypothetical protein